MAALYGWPGFVLLAVLYLIVGQVGHDPWRGDDGLYLGPVVSMLKGEGWVVPRVAGEAYLEFPPLFYWVGSFIGGLLGQVMPLHDAVRLTTTLFAGAALYFLSDAAQRLYGETARAPAALLMLGSLGLVVHVHEVQPQIALLAAQGLSFFGIARLSEQGWRAAILAGLGAAAAALSVGLVGVLLTWPLFILLLCFCSDCKTPVRRVQVVLALLIGAVLPGIWLYLLAEQGVGIWQQFWAKQMVFAEQFEFVHLSYFFATAAWFTWPLWPIACWTIWRERQNILKLQWLMPLSVVVLACIILICNGRPSPAEFIPLLAPMALLSAAGMPGLRRGAANAFDWFGVMTFAVLALVACLAWSAVVFSWPPGLARQALKQAPGFKQAFSWPTLCAVCIWLGLWVGVVWKMPKSRVRGASNWALGMVMLWCLSVKLLLPWFDYNKSYRPLSMALKKELVQYSYTCVAGYGLSSSQRATIDYFSGIRTVPLGAEDTNCELLLLSDERRALPSAFSHWTPVWTLRRAGKKQSESFRLYQKPKGNKSANFVKH